ncbi:MAG: glycosyltransferase [Elusimicrobia bacterium]|nr:glycosyltransferase [Elusimicrobiota bacterium]
MASAYGPCPICGAAPAEIREATRLGRPECRACAALLPPPAPGDGGEIGSAVHASELSKKEVYVRGLDLIESRAPRGRILDVGAGHGVFLTTAAARGWRAVGAEPDPRAAGNARAAGLDVRTSMLAALEESPGSFSAATLWDSLDMLDDPLTGLLRVKELLEEGGVVLIRVRNAPAHRAVWRTIGSLGGLASPVVHRFGLGRRSLSILLARAGLEALSIRNSPLTRGDPYQGSVGWRLGAVASLKCLVACLADAVARVTGGACLVGPSLWVLARKPSRPIALHVITRLDPGGSAESTLDQMRRWSDPGLRYVVASGGDKTPEGVIRVPHLRRELSPRADARALCELRRLIRDVRPAVVHTHSSKAGVLGRLAVALNRRAGAPDPAVVHTAHGHVFYGYSGPVASWLYRSIEVLCASWTDRFVALTEGEREETISYGVGARDRWRVVPSGTSVPEDPGAFADAGREIRGRLKLHGVVFGGALRLERVKGPDVWMEASALAARRASTPLCFIALGFGPLRASLVQSARRFGVLDLWRFPGQTEDVLSHLAAMDVYVQPSRNEGMGRALVQAQSMELPVVASRVCGIPSVVRDGETALLVPPEDPDALAEAMIRLADDEALRRTLGAAGRRWVLSKDETGHPRFSPEAASARLADVYRELVARDGGAR